mmetsp:Transcript_58200/g.137202  ORF Transcript_58200/g.137202 Transcript_58200/m.137202 type:complete len:247 (-) Transcript_58200:251-991(-)
MNVPVVLVTRATCTETVSLRPEPPRSVCVGRVTKAALVKLLAPVSRTGSTPSALGGDCATTRASACVPSASRAPAVTSDVLVRNRTLAATSVLALTAPVLATSASQATIAPSSVRAVPTTRARSMALVFTTGRATARRGTGGWIAPRSVLGVSITSVPTMAFVGTTTCAPVAWASGGSTAPRVVLGPLLATWTATKFGCVTAPAMGSATITRNATVLGVGAAVTAPLRRKATSYSSSSAVSSSRSP